MYAVTIEPLRAIAFLSAPPEGSQWQVQEGVEIDIPSTYSDWPDGANPSKQVLCISTSDPKHYKLFKDQRDVDQTEFRDTGMNFGGVFSKTSWDRFATVLPGALAATAVDVDEPPGATDEAIRALKAGHSYSGSR
jgi:hypothetical protein